MACLGTGRKTGQPQDGQSWGSSCRCGKAVTSLITFVLPMWEEVPPAPLVDLDK